MSDYKPHPLRIQRRRTKGFRLPPGACSVTRPGKWGNCFTTADEFDDVFGLVRSGLSAKEIGITDQQYAHMAMIARDPFTINGRTWVYDPSSRTHKPAGIASCEPSASSGPNQKERTMSELSEGSRRCRCSTDQYIARDDDSEPLNDQWFRDTWPEEHRSDNFAIECDCGWLEVFLYGEECRGWSFAGNGWDGSRFDTRGDVRRFLWYLESPLIP